MKCGLGLSELSQERSVTAHGSQRRTTVPRTGDSMEGTRKMLLVSTDGRRRMSARFVVVQKEKHRLFHVEEW